MAGESTECGGERTREGAETHELRRELSLGRTRFGARPRARER